MRDPGVVQVLQMKVSLRAYTQPPAVQLTFGLFAKIPHELARAILHNPLLVVVPHRVAFYTEHLQLIQEAQLTRQIFQLVLIQQQPLEVREHANLRW